MKNWPSLKFAGALVVVSAAIATFGTMRTQPSQSLVAIAAAPSKSISAPTIQAERLVESTAFVGEYSGYHDTAVENYGAKDTSNPLAAVNPVTQMQRMLHSTILRGGTPRTGPRENGNEIYTLLNRLGIVHVQSFPFFRSRAKYTGREYPLGSQGTYLTQPNSAGSGATIAVADASSFVAGGSVIVDLWGDFGLVGSGLPGAPPSVRETLTVASVDSANRVVTFTSALRNAHPRGAIVDVANDPALPQPVTVAQIVASMDDNYNYAGGYPGFIEGQNEPNDTVGLGDNDPETANDPEGGEPWWATLAVRSEENLLAARNSNMSRYGNVAVVSDAYAINGRKVNGSSNPHQIHAQAALDLNATRPSQVALPIPVTYVACHCTDAFGAPELAGGIAAITPRYSYAKAVGGNATVVFDRSISPEWWTEVLHSSITNYFHKGVHGLNDDLAAHFIPRNVLAAVAHGVQKSFYDFPSDHQCRNATTSFCDNGWMDFLGNLRPQAYASINLSAKLYDPGRANCNALTHALTPVDFNVTRAAGSDGPTDKIVAYAYQKCDGTSWLALVRATEEYTHYAAIGQPGAINGGNVLVRAGSVPVNVTLRGATASTYKNVTVFQNDEYCNLTHNQQPTVAGAPSVDYPAGITGARADCEQYWPAGSLRAVASNPVQPTNPTLSSAGGQTSFTVNTNGMPLLVELSSGPPAPIPTVTPLAPIAPNAYPTPNRCEAACPPAAPSPIPTLAPPYMPPGS